MLITFRTFFFIFFAQRQASTCQMVMVEILSTRGENPDKFLPHNSSGTGREGKRPQGIQIPQKERKMSPEKLGLKKSQLFHRFSYFTSWATESVCSLALLRVIRENCN